MVNDQLEVTGERYHPFLDPKIFGPEIHYEHLHRYYFASKFIKNKLVLDLGCGDGYGSHILSKSAKYVIGLDYDEHTINHARRKYLKDNLKFILGSAIDIPIGKEKIFDIIICFEVLEHLREHNRFISEIRRLLKDQGILIISTPDKRLFRRKRQPNYKSLYHKKELHFDEFKDLLKTKFKHVCIYGQRIFTGSHIWPLSDLTSICEEHIIEKKRNTFSLIDLNKKEHFYLIAIASNRKLDTSNLCFKSYLTDTSNIIVERIRILEKQIAVTSSDIEKLSSDIEKIKSSLAYRIYMRIRKFLPIK